MKVQGKVYFKMNGRYIECTETVEDLENKITELKEKVNNSPSFDLPCDIVSIKHCYFSNRYGCDKCPVKEK